ncbi:MAG: PKD domain-containing protein, partial [Dehalococcoidia bacterium]|nr:PKD domain-containing protein [Dehalococcoidia bacterium]
MIRSYMRIVSLAVALVFMLALAVSAAGPAFGAVWTDQADYYPGSLVTISGDNSDGAGYLAGELVQADVNGPNGFTASCHGLANESGAWACQFIIWPDERAVGDYTYVATGLTSGVSQAGTFTDANVSTTTTLNAISTPLTTEQLGVSYSGQVSASPAVPDGQTVKLQVRSGGCGTTGFADITTTTTTSGNGSFSSTFSAPSTAGTYGFRASFPSTGNIDGNSNRWQNSTSTCQAVTVNSANTPPAVAASNPTVTVNEGQTAANTGTYSDDNGGDNVAIAPSLGTVTKTGTNSGTWSWSFATTDGPAQSQTVTITANDGNGGVSTTTFALTVNNVAPIIALTGDPSVSEGSLYTLNLGAVTDPGADTVTGYKVNWGDGASDSFPGSPVGLSKTHTYADGPNSYTISVDLTDEDGIFAGAGTKAVTVNNVAPTISLVSNDGPINEGSSASITVVATDPAGADDPLSYEFDCNNDGTFEKGPQAGNSASCSFADNGSFSVNVRVNDGDGGVVTSSTVVTVNNVAPAIALTGDASVSEGSLYTLNLGAVTDPGADTVTGYKVNWGDGASDSFPGSPVGLSKTHTYADG